MAERSPTKTALKKTAVSVRDLDEAEVRGVFNTAFTDETDGGDSQEYEGGGWFMLSNPEFTNHKVDFMEEIKNSPWYYGRISREKSQEILNDNVSPGTFIVRSGLKESEFYISVRVEEPDSKVRHIEVDRYQNDFAAALGDQSMSFATFGQLLDYLQSTPIHFEGCEHDVLLKDYVDRLGITIF